MLRTICFCSALLMAASLAISSAAGQDDPALAATIQSMSAGFQGHLSFYAHDLATGKVVAINADRPVATASTIKLAILYEALEQIRAGRIHWEDRLTVNHADQVEGSGVLLFFDPPLTITLKDALTLMIALSDNTAANLAMDHVGIKNVNDRLVTIGMKNTWLYKKVMQPAEGPMPADQKQFGLGKTTAREMAALMERIVTCNLGPAPPRSGSVSGIPSDQTLCSTARHMLKVQFYRDSIPRYLDKLDSSDGDSAVANKTGSLNHVRNDVGAVFARHGTIILSEFTVDNSDTSWTVDNSAELLIARLARATVEAWDPQDWNAAQK